MFPPNGVHPDLDIGHGHDADICRRVESQLGSAGYLALRDVRCELDNGMLCLRGCLRSFYLKQVAQAVAARLAGIPPLENRIEVVVDRCGSCALRQHANEPDGLRVSALEQGAAWGSSHRAAQRTPARLEVTP
jgi:hypothetical protein